MTIIQSIILGIIQGLTEFLPISSSAHLVIVPFFLGWSFPEKEAFIFNVLVQDGTLLAVIIYFWKDLISILKGWFQALLARQPFRDAEARMGWYLILATIPAGIFGLAIKKNIEAAFSSPLATGVFLLVTAVLLFVAEQFGRRQRALESITWLDALVMGLFQAIAVFPGVSRSGATITGGMLRNLNRTAAARFSFLMAVPVMLASGLVEVLDLAKFSGLSSFLPVVVAGFIVAAIVGYLSIRWLLKYLMQHSLRVFSIYCVIIGIVTIAFAYVRR
jgi:undecaprenyl-diphosphatase